jgi:hypothetical protein
MPAPKEPATTPSLPGANSTRTDGGIADKQVIRQLTGYDTNSMETNKSFAEVEGGAPMPNTNMPGAPAGPTTSAPDTASLPSLTGPSTRPWESVTADAVLPQPVDPRQQESNDLIARYLPDLQAGLSIPGVPDSYRKFINFLSKQAQ